MAILSSIANVRDLGGIILPDGHKVKYGLLLRGGALVTATDADIAEMSECYHVSKVFDFRTQGEVRHAPDREIPGSVNIWMPAFDEKSMEMEKLALPSNAYRDLTNWLLENAGNPIYLKVAMEMYTHMVKSEFTQIQYAGFLQNIVSNADGAVYWHCSQGKDRTGLAAAFLLAALGADREVIMKDYMRSEAFYHDQLEMCLSQVSTEEEAYVIRTFVSVNPDSFSRALDYIDRTWGSMQNFLTGPLCLGEEDIAVLKERYLEN